MSEIFSASLTNLLSILDAFQDDILVVDSEGIVIEANVQAKTNLFPDFKRYAREALETTISKMLNAYRVDHPEKFYEKINILQKSKFLTDRFTIRLNKNKREKYYEVSSSPIFVKESGFVGRIWAFRDATESKKLDQEKSDFLAVASSQLKNPIFSILQNSSTLHNRINEIPADLRWAVDSIQKSVEHTNGIIDDLLNISWLEKKENPINPTEVDINQIIVQVANDLGQKIMAKGLKLNYIPQSSNTKIVSDQGRIKETLKNILDNAIKYSHNNNSIDISVSNLNDKIAIKISDHGIGIPLQDQSKLFSKFFRANNVTTENYDGTGIGLYYVAKAIKDLKGHIGFQSEEGKGTTFEVLLPMKI